MAPAAVACEACSMPETISNINGSKQPKFSDPMVTEMEVINDDSSKNEEDERSPETATIPRLHISPDYRIKERPLGSIRPIRIVCLGAGASGVNLAYQVQQRLRKTELVIYEKNPAIGGTWYENRYPGCKCDIREPSSAVS